MSRWIPYLGGLLMMLLDVVIDPVALEGEKWFLGKIYTYPYNGFYFGVTAANFAGWFFVGWLSQKFFQKFCRILPWCNEPMNFTSKWFSWGIFGVYAGVFLFNLGVTVYIRDQALARASFIVIMLTLLPIMWILKRRYAK
jgi:putative membrane protein